LNLGWPADKKFLVPEDVAEFFKSVKKEGVDAETSWREIFGEYKKAHKDLAIEFDRRISGELPDGWSDGLKTFETDPKGMATRKSSGIILNEIAENLPELVGGSADLTPSNKTWINSSSGFQKNNHAGRYLHFGVREHGMGAIVNGIAYHGGFIPYGSTFLVFSDYMRPSVRISALSNLGAIWIFTHDSIGLGEDGPTHQPVEQVMSLRTIPNLNTIRPADANEVREAWVAAINHRHTPTALVFSRQNLPTFDRDQFAGADGLHKGAYVMADLGDGKPEIILMASGSEVWLIVEAGRKLIEDGHSVRIVSFPCWELFEKQSKSYKKQVLDPAITKRMAVEAGVSLGWHKWIGSEGTVVGIDKFGASAPGIKVMDEYGFSVEKIYKKAKELVK